MNTVSPNIIISDSENDIIKRLNELETLANKFLKKNKQYQSYYRIFKVNDNAYCLIFKFLPKNRYTVIRQYEFNEESFDIYWNQYINEKVAC